MAEDKDTETRYILVRYDTDKEEMLPQLFYTASEAHDYAYKLSEYYVCAIEVRRI